VAAAARRLRSSPRPRRELPRGGAGSLESWPERRASVAQADAYASRDRARGGDAEAVEAFIAARKLGATFRRQRDFRLGRRSSGAAGARFSIAERPCDVAISGYIAVPPRRPFARAVAAAFLAHGAARPRAPRRDQPRRRRGQVA
jgi:hypothetical protein